jgi:hypothetical protein
MSASVEANVDECLTCGAGGPYKRAATEHEGWCERQKQEMREWIEHRAEISRQNGRKSGYHTRRV